MHKKILNYIFDLDGTLINSSEEVLMCLKKAFITANCFIDETLFKSDIIGPPVKDIIKNLTPDIQDEIKLNEVMQNFRLIYDYDENDISVLYSGIEDFIKDLKESGCKLFVATFKPKIPTIRLVNKFFPNVFDDVYTIDKYDKTMTKSEMLEDIISKYGLNKSETVMIGDAQSDMLAAKSVGRAGIGVMWGYSNDKIGLLELADICIQNIEELRCQQLNYRII